MDNFFFFYFLIKIIKTTQIYFAAANKTLNTFFYQHLAVGDPAELLGHMLI